MRLLSVTGARPQFVKAAPCTRAARQHHVDGSCTPGSTTTTSCRDVFYDELGLGEPDVRLGVGSGLARRADRRACSSAIERGVRSRRRPDAMLVYGDTNSTLAGALVGGQAAPAGRPRRGRPALVRPCACRRRSTASSPTTSRALLFCPSQTRGREPRGRGHRATASTLVGDVMVDVAPHARADRERALAVPRGARRSSPAATLLATVAPRRQHRAARARPARRARSAASTSRSCCRCTRARARRSTARACWPSSSARRARAAAARLPRLHGPPARRPRCA